jgi:hypothetical protein
LGKQKLSADYADYGDFFEAIAGTAGVLACMFALAASSRFERSI